MAQKPTYEELEQRVKELEKEAIKQKLAEESLRESEEKYRSLVESTEDSIYLIDRNYRYLFMNNKHLGRFGLPMNRVVGATYGDFHSEEETEEFADKVRQVFETGKSLWYEYRSRRDGGYFLRTLSPVKGPDGTTTAVTVVSKNITERKQAEEHIVTLTQELIRAQESERQKIARELHDRVAQDLSTAKITCETLFDNQAPLTPETKQKTLELSTILQGGITAVRDLSYDLRPPSLDQLGLVRTVFEYCEDFAEKNDVSVDFYSAGMDDLSLGFDIEINLYRLIQEGFNNIKKHADASHVIIKLVASFPNIILRIEDDGKGFDVSERLVRALNEKHMGLSSMQERVSLLQGRMEIESRPMQGTKIFIEVPYKEKRSGPNEKHIDR